MARCLSLRRRADGVTRAARISVVPRPCAPLAVIVLFAASVGGAAAKGGGPTAIAAGYGSVWVGLGNGSVVVLPTALGRMEQLVAASPTGYIHGLTARFGAVWILRSGVFRTQVTRIDPVHETRVVVPGVGSPTAFAIAAGAGAIWVADDGRSQVLRINAWHPKVEARVRVPGRAWGIAAGASAVIVVSVPGRSDVNGPEGVRLLRRIDPKTNRLSPPLARLKCDAGVAVGSRAVWTFDGCTGALARRDPKTLHVVSETQTHVLSQVPALGFGSVWLASRGGVIRIDPETLRVRARIAARSIWVTVGSRFVWALSGSGKRAATLRKIDPVTNRVVGAATIPVRP
jgi:DNA-binding beta-propeller fold protein YncE